MRKHFNLPFSGLNMSSKYRFTQKRLCFNSTKADDCLFRGIFDGPFKQNIPSTKYEMYKYFPKYILSKIDLELSNYRKKYPLVLYFYMFNNTFIFTFMYVYTTT